MARRAAALAVLVTLPAAALAIVAAGAMTEGYDPLTTTISRLAVPGHAAAAIVDVAIGATGCACIALALAVGRARPALVVAGIGFVVAAAIHLDPSSATSTAAHRSASAAAVVGLTVAPLQLSRAYGKGFVAAWLLEVAMLALAAVLLLTPFSWWGAWERLLLAVALLWMLTAATIAFRAATTTARPAAVSSTGS